MKLKRTLSLIIGAAMAVSCFAACGDSDDSQTSDSAAQSDNSQTESEAQPSEGDTLQEMRDITAWELVQEMNTGWNLGNTLDANGSSGVEAETSWGNPVTTKEMIDAVKEAGFNVLRVPVSWGTHMDDDYNVEEEWMARVREVVDYGINNDMYVILNTHHEEWYFPTEEDKEQDIEQLTALWTQIAEEFQNYDEHLIFEGLNEPRLRGTALEWTGGDEASRAIVNEYAKAFYETVRNSGGNNPNRHLMITGYAASSSRNCLEAIDLSEFDDKVIVSVHAYLPYSFALDTQGTDQFNADTDGGVIDTLFNDLNDLFLSKNIPVIVGEYGCVNKYNPEERVECIEYYLNVAKEAGVPCIWWDNGAFFGTGENFGILDRSVMPTWKFPEVVDAIMGVYEE